MVSLFYFDLLLFVIFNKIIVKNFISVLFRTPIKTFPKFLSGALLAILNIAKQATVLVAGTTGGVATRLLTNRCR